MNLLGTKLECATCGGQVVVTAGGDGEIRCHDAPMNVIAGGAADAGARVAREQRGQGDTSEDVEYY